MIIKKLTVLRKDLIPDTGEGEYVFTESTFNPESGHLLEEIRYTQDGQVEEVVRREYDNSGFLTLEKLLDSDGTTLEKRTFEADSQGLIFREFIHYSDEFADRIEYSYDEKGRVTNKELFNDDDELESTELFEYNGDLLAREAELDEDGKLLNERKYLFDEKGLLEEEEIIDNEQEVYLKKIIARDETGKIEDVTTYNKNEEAVERMRYTYNEQGKPLTITDETRIQKNTTTLSYNETGEITLEEEHDLKGQLVRKIERKFNDQGLVSETKVLIRNYNHGVTRSYVLTNKYSFL